MKTIMKLSLISGLLASGIVLAIFVEGKCTIRKQDSDLGK